MNKHLLNSRDLEKSSVVANSLMNRERKAIGSNSYQHELGFNPIEYIVNILNEKVRTACLTSKELQVYKAKAHNQQTSFSWLDICCGSGKALIESTEILTSKGFSDRVKLIGIDLVDFFQPYDQNLTSLQLLATSVNDYNPNQQFDLITCIHGLHYIGDKLSIIKKAISWLEPTGLFVANIDLDNLRFEDGTVAGRSILATLRKQGVVYKNHLLKHKGNKLLRLPYEYLGASDKAGPNYTGQASVNSYYQKING
jgi:2-polyprenyl-3-methyl-5-hydroxy-6-metoxy-1,4-benzoquinol methylase